MERVNGADAWRVAGDHVTLDVTVTGGMGTAEFRFGDPGSRLSPTLRPGGETRRSFDGSA